MNGTRGTSRSLESIRHDLAEIDRAIVLMVAARIESACLAIQCRSEQDGRISDPAQEERVIARAQVWGREVGLSPELAETIFRAMVRAGKERFVARATAPVAVPIIARARHRRSSRDVTSAARRTAVPT